MSNSLFPAWFFEIVDKFKKFFSSKEYECLPLGWPEPEGVVGGWHDESIARTQKQRWPLIKQSVQGTGPLTTAYSYVSPDATVSQIVPHNIIMSYAYALALASKTKNSLTLLDWGGGVGLYLLIAKTLYPELGIDYYCYETPQLCDLGRKIWTEAIFYDKQEDALQRKYELVIASSSLQYFKDWNKVLRDLAHQTQSFLYVNRLPIAKTADSFVVKQKCFQNKNYGYDTEVVSWIINEQEFLNSAEQTGIRLVREFLCGEHVSVAKAPEMNIETRGFLFSANKD